MDSSTNIDLLFTRFQEQLSLQWIAGQEGKHRPLENRESSRDFSLVGYLNTIHPNQLQILGHKEMEYYSRLDEESRQALLTNLFNNKPAAVIIAEGNEVPVSMRIAAEQSQTPLFLSKLSSSKLIDNLRHIIDDTLATKTVIHGVLLEVHGLGVLLTGESAIGKSELALELITRNHRLIADDAPEFSRAGPNTIRGSCPDALRDFMEVRGLGILNIRSMYGDSAIKFSKDLRLVIHLKYMKDEDMVQVDRLKGSYGSRTILDVDIPTVTLPVASGRNLAVLVEAAVKHHILLRKGYNSSDAFITRQQKLINEKNQEQ
ncbi:HPr(Ser) kinase/phosphatase [Kaarinaea lacus]